MTCFPWSAPTMRKNVWLSARFSVAVRAYSSYLLPMWSYCASCSVMDSSLFSYSPPPERSGDAERGASPARGCLRGLGRFSPSCMPTDDQLRHVWHDVDKVLVKR